jgi:hypothetical protein
MEGKRYRVAWLHSGKSALIGGKALKRSQGPAALFLEGSLDGDLRSERTEQPILREYLRAYDIRLASKDIHSLADLDHLRSQLKRLPSLFVHISCHGSCGEDGSRTPYITLSPAGERISLKKQETVETFHRHFAGRHVLISACELGKYGRPMAEFKRNAGLASLAVFSREICDHEAVLFDMCVYHCMIERGWAFKKAIKRSVESLKSMGSPGATGRNQALVRVF